MKLLNHLRINQRLWGLLGLMVVTILGLSAYMLTSQHRLLLQQKALEIHGIVETATSVAANYHARAGRGEMDEDAAKAAALQAISALRFDGNNYFWVMDGQPRMLMHPMKPQLNGQSLAEIKDPEGTALFSEMAAVVRRDGQGLVPYLWPRPGSDKPISKYSFVEGFKPWAG